MSDFLVYAARLQDAGMSEADVKRSHQYVKGLMRGIDLLQARKAMKRATP